MLAKKRNPGRNGLLCHPLWQTWMTWMPTKELMQVRVALQQGNLQQTNIPKADGFCKDERLLLKSMSIPFGNSILLKWTCQSNWNIRSLWISYWKTNTFLDISIHFNPEMSEAPTCTLGNPHTCGLGWLLTPWNPMEKMFRFTGGNWRILGDPKKWADNVVSFSA